jgi:hypothetical protein
MADAENVEVVFFTCVHNGLLLSDAFARWATAPGPKPPPE